MNKSQQPAPLHYLACYVLHLMWEDLKSLNSAQDFKLNHRLIFEYILFFCSETLRRNGFGFEVTLQTKLFAPTEGSRAVRLDTVNTVLNQCCLHEPAWMVPPSVECLNFRLTNQGERLIYALKQNQPIYILCGGQDIKLYSKNTLEMIRKVVHRWTGQPPHILKREFPRIACYLFVKEKTLVPYYDFSKGFRVAFVNGIK